MGRYSYIEPQGMQMQGAEQASMPADFFYYSILRWVLVYCGLVVAFCVRRLFLYIDKASWYNGEKLSHQRERMIFMDNNKRDSRINQILNHLAGAAVAAADSVNDAVQAGKAVVGEKYDTVKLRVELTRLQHDQRALFADIGRTMHLIQSGSYAAGTPSAEQQLVDAQQTVDRLLLLADQKQQEIDLVEERLYKLDGSKVCAVCGKVCDEADAYCSKCGAQLFE